MLYSCQNGNGVIEDANFEYFISHLPARPIIGVMVKLYYIFNDKPNEGDRIKDLDCFNIVIVGITTSDFIISRV